MKGTLSSSAGRAIEKPQMLIVVGEDQVAHPPISCDVNIPPSHLHEHASSLRLPVQCKLPEPKIVIHDTDAVEETKGNKAKTLEDTLVGAGGVVGSGVVGTDSPKEVTSLKALVPGSLAVPRSLKLQHATSSGSMTNGQWETSLESLQMTRATCLSKRRTFVSFVSNAQRTRCDPPGGVPLVW